MKNLSTVVFSFFYKGLSPNILRKSNLKRAENKKLRVIFFIFLCIFLANFILAAEKININAASREDLQRIIWIGPVMAQRIIDARPFYSLDEITRVNGIGSKKLEDIKKQGLAWTGPALETEAVSAAVEEGQSIEPLEIESAPVETKKEKGSLININTASLQELQKIIGIGAALGQRITDMRPFYSLDELVKVHGIGAATLEKIKNQGLAWVNPEFAPPETEEIGLIDKNLTSAPVPLRQVQGKELPKNFLALLAPFVLSFLSGIIILILKKNLKTTS